MVKLNRTVQMKKDLLKELFIFHEATFRGKKGEIKACCLMDSGSVSVILPNREEFKKIGPTPKGHKLISLADETKSCLKKVYEIEVEMVDDEGKPRRCLTWATFEEREEPIIGVAAMKDLGILLNMKEHKLFL
jgi:predicted aspartyl protease